MKQSDIYNAWKASFPTDPRYLRPRRWEQLKDLILSKKLKRILEFGSGVSTLLFESLGLSVTSYETNKLYMEKVRKLTNNVTFYSWDNITPSPLPLGTYGLAFIDGALPRDSQLKHSLKHSIYMAIDDYEKEDKEQFSKLLSPHTRIDNLTTSLAIFKVKNV